MSAGSRFGRIGLMALVFIVLGGGLGGSGTVRAQDALPFFTQTGVSPDILFVLDGSFAMLCKADLDGTAPCPGPSQLPLSSKDTSLAWTKLTRAYRAVNTIKSIVNDYSPLGIRFGLAMTSYTTKAINACKPGLTMVNIGSNNASAMNTALDTYLTRLRSITLNGNATKDHELVFDSAKTIYTTSITSDINKNCRKRIVLFVTGGGGSIRQECMDGSAIKIDALYNLPTQPGVGAQGNIYTYVMGFNLDEDMGNGYDKLVLMATAGRTTEPRSAKSSVEFTGIMNQVLNNLLAGSYNGCDPVLSTYNEDLYQAYFRIYDPAAYPDYLSWEGHIANYPLDADGELRNRLWDTAITLNAKSVSARKIYSSYNDGVSPYAVLEFKTSNVLALAPLISVAHDLDGDGDILSGDQNDTNYLIDFIRGDTSKYYYTGHQREPYRLLDIIRSTPDYISPPSAPSGDPDYYQVFQPAQVLRPDMLIAGSNGGMIHVVEAAQYGPSLERLPSPIGDEKWSYIPQHLLPKLGDLWRWDAHATFVDGRGASSDVKVRTSATAPLTWRTVFAVGDSIYGDQTSCASALAGLPSLLWNCGWYTALDVSAKSGVNFVPSPLWEFMGDGDIINARSEPAFGVLKVKFPVNAPSAELRDVMFLPGMGITTSSYNGNAICYSPVYVVDPGTGQELSKIVLPYVSGQCDPDDLRGIRSRVVAVDSNNDLVDDRIYVGDMQGQLWRVDLSSTNPADWASSSKRTRIFAPSMFPETAGDAPLPVTFAVATTFTGAGNILIYFGLGDAETLDDFGDPPPAGNFYVMHDNEIISSGSSRLFNDTGEFEFPEFDDGEVMAGEPELVAGVVYFTTYIHSQNDCSMGTGRLYGLQYLTGAPGLDSDGDGALDSKFVELGYGIPSGVVIGTNRWYVTMNDGSLGGLSGDLTGSGVDTRSATTVEPLMPYSWAEVVGR